jgi:hypothetical protein
MRTFGRDQPVWVSHEKLRFWRGDGDSRVATTRSCFYSRRFDTLQSLVTRCFLRPARRRLSCRRRPPRAAVAAAVSWDGGRDLVGRRGLARCPSCSRAGTYHSYAHDEGRIRSLSMVRVHRQHPRAHALVQTVRYSTAPLTLGFQTRNDNKIKSIEVAHIYFYRDILVTLNLV